MAGRWFGVVATKERPGRSRKVGRELRVAIWANVQNATWGLLGSEPTCRCDVWIIRRDTGRPVEHHVHREPLSEAGNHVENLRYRLETTHVYDFCREFRIGTDEVAGPGISGEQDPATIWTDAPPYDVDDRSDR